ncbi:hypothetical protein KPATCC21470_0132 [Kitasatospora purpeofusca]
MFPPFRQPAPSPVPLDLLGSEPHCRTPSTRARSLGAFTGIPRTATAGTAQLDFTYGHCTCSTALPLGGGP